MTHSRDVFSGFALLTVAGALGASASAVAAQTAPAQQQNEQTAPNLAQVKAPAGQYTLTPDHAFLNFEVLHLGISDYVMRFRQFQVALAFRPGHWDQSSVTATIDPNSIAVDYQSSYKKTHPKSEYSSWPQELAQSKMFLDAGRYPQIRYQSTRITQAGPDTLRIEGKLTLHGQTHPVTLRARLTGSTASDPLAKVPSVGFSVTGAFKRSDFGIDSLSTPPVVISDRVQLDFEGGFLREKDGQ